MQTIFFCEIAHHIWSTYASRKPLFLKSRVPLLALQTVNIKIPE